MPARMSGSVSAVEAAVERGLAVYGVTTGFGGMSGVTVPGELAAESQNNLLNFLGTGAGNPIERRHVRGAMLLRANVLARGYSGVRYELVDRLIRFVESNATPIVRELGSIGASGDLVPLSSIARAITGHNKNAAVQLGERIVPVSEVLTELGLSPLRLQPKEGLALVNGTSFSSAIAANCVDESIKLMGVALGAQAMMLEALLVQPEPYDEFVQRCKPHPGQVWTARTLRSLLNPSREHLADHQSHVQDRYALRCFPQYMGPIVEGIARICETIETEMNAVSDNPLIDPVEQRFHQSGNFLGQYVALAMDDLRQYIGLMSKHLDVQIATLVEPHFSNGLSASLCGNEELSINMGLKGLQITGNSIMPMLTWYGNPIVQHFPTHAEQFNQNVNGLSWSSANLAWESIRLFQHYLSVSLVFAVQAVDLRAKICCGDFDGRKLLNPDIVPLYETIHAITGCPLQADRPYLFDDQDHFLETHLAKLYQDLSQDGPLTGVTKPISDSFSECFLDDTARK